MIQMYGVEFNHPNGQHFRLDTTDPAKIGPWLAEMFGLFPWHPSWGGSPVRITTHSVTPG